LQQLFNEAEILQFEKIAAIQELDSGGRAMMVPFNWENHGHLKIIPILTSIMRLTKADMIAAYL
jgi:hypothetical protein